MKQSIWSYCGNYYKAYTEDDEIQAKLKGLQLQGCHLADSIRLLDSKRGCFYVFPVSLYDQVQTLFQQLPNENGKILIRLNYRNLIIVGLIVLGVFISKFVAH